MLCCFECKNLDLFAQVSAQADMRSIRMTPSGPVTSTWDTSDHRPEALYCARCDAPVEGDLEYLGLVDDRIAFLDPLDFDPAQAAEAFRLLRPDATWSEFTVPAAEATFSEVPQGLAPGLVAALERSGRGRLWSHQAEAIEGALAGQSVVQATAAGSGKSLGLTMPVLSELANDPKATALAIFPLKALANDQLNSLFSLGTSDSEWMGESSFDLELAHGAERIRVAKYDGSTPNSERGAARSHARLLVTNPDMLHTAVLPWANRDMKQSWARFFTGLRYVILDEIHAYQGVFGSNVALVLRRLRRMARRYGSDPQFLCASATIGNPVQHAERLTGVGGFRLVDNDGAGRAERRVLICNPPVLAGGSGDAGPRVAPQTIAIEVMASALHGAAHLPIRTIAFSRSRNQVTQLAQRLRGRLRDERQSELAGGVRAYMATLLDEDRAVSEDQLRDGSTLAVVSTSALELGIDIPDLSLAVLEGYPGQISSFRQRIGRAGRKGSGLAVLIVGDDPIQQYLAREPEALKELLEGRAESIVINPESPEIAERYGLAPAQEELGGIFQSDEAFFGAALVGQWLGQAVGAPTAELLGEPGWQLQTQIDQPHHLGLRSGSSSKPFDVVVRESGGRGYKPVGRIDEASAPRDCFVPAIWSGPNDELYRITHFDLQERRITCEGPLAEIDHQTRGVVRDIVDILDTHRESVETTASVADYAALSISRTVPAYREVHFSGREVNCEPEASWPPVRFDTDGLVLTIRDGVLDQVPARDASLRATEHLLLSAAPIILACDPHDIDAQSSAGRIFLYDSFGGGLRFSEVLLERLPELVDLAFEMVATCSCADGCPSCVMLNRRPDGNQDLSKAGAHRLLELLRSADVVEDSRADGTDSP